MLRTGFGLAVLALGADQGRRWMDKSAQAAEEKMRAIAEAEEEHSKATIAQLYRHKSSWMRLVQLLVFLLPCAFMWPLWLVSPASFWVVVASQLEKCGPCFVKLSQWLATRRDIFPDEVCIAFGRLHEQVGDAGCPGRPAEEVKKQLEEQDVKLRYLSPTAHASGSIGEVFFGELEDGTAVAVKCMRPGIRRIIDGDLSWLLRLAQKSDQHPVLRMYGLSRAAELFCAQVCMQTDFEAEARNLLRFRENFSGQSQVIRFPEPLYVSSDYLVLSREKGEEMSKIFREADASDSASAPSVQGTSLEVRAETLRRFLGVRKEVCGGLATESMACFMQMLFKDSFIHGDLHPGNILVRFTDCVNSRTPKGDEQKDPGLVERVADMVPDRLRRLVGLPLRSLGFELVVLDAGLAVPLPPEKVEALRRMAVATLYADYIKAAKVVIDVSPDTSQCKDQEAFLQEMADILRNVRKNVWQQGFLQVSDAAMQFCQLVQRHHVYLDTTLSWAILAMMSVEGAARQFDPHVDATGAATRYIISPSNLIKELGDGSLASSKEMITQMVMERCGFDFWAFRNWRLQKWNEEEHRTDTKASAHA